jgi:hypothetical protein
VLLGLLTRLAAIPLIVNMCVAMLSTKIPILLGESFWGFELPRTALAGPNSEQLRALLKPAAQRRLQPAGRDPAGRHVLRHE